MKHNNVYVSLSLDHLSLKPWQEKVCAHYALSPRPELHVTLGFLGDVEEEPLLALSHELAQLTKEPLGELKIFGTGGAFKDAETSRISSLTYARSMAELQPLSRVLWWVVEPSEGILRCQRALRAALEKLKLSTNQLATEFYPHITIGSFSGATESNQKFWDVYQAEKTATLGLFLSPKTARVERLHITKVELHPQSLFSVVEYGQRAGVVVWLTGWPASGKSTVARALRRRLAKSIILDSDEVRAAVFPGLGYSDDERAQFYVYLSGMAALLAKQGLVVLVAATANKRLYREEARRKTTAFIEVYISTSKEESASRDPKRLYEEGKIAFPYEPPLSPEVTLESASDEVGLTRLLEKIGEIAG